MTCSLRSWYREHFRTFTLFLYYLHFGHTRFSVLKSSSRSVAHRRVACRERRLPEADFPLHSGGMTFITNNCSLGLLMQ
jgi:hypothetical protein